MSEKPSFDNVGESNPNKPSLVERTRSTNEAGAPSFEAFTPEFALYKVVINNLLEDSFYDDAEESFDKVWNAFQQAADENPEFVLQLATHARQEEGFRDISQLLLVLAANDDRTKQYVRQYAPAIIDRTDEFNTVMSYQLRGFGNPNKPLKKGITDALHKKYAIVEVGYSGTSETERVTYIEADDEEVDSDRRLDAQTRAAERIADRNGLNADDFTDIEIVDEGYVHDEYTFSKYSQRDKEVSLHDVINLVRPAPRSDNRDEMFGRIVKGELDDHEDVEPLREDRTWEATRSDDEDDRSEREQWLDRLDDMGLMARVRNLRNMKQAGLSGREVFDYDDEEVEADGLDISPEGLFGRESERVVKNSKILPFRFYQAYKACGETGVSRSLLSSTTKSFDIGRGDLLDQYDEAWLNDAIDVGTENLPDTLENTFTAIDLSGSMDRTVSGDSEMARAEIASLFGAMLMKRESDVGAFGSDFATIEADESARRTTPVLDIAQRIYSVGDEIGNNTNGWKALDWATSEGVEYDRFVVFTDEQIWDSTTGGIFGSSSSRTLKSAWDEYTDEVNPDAHLYVIDLASYGDLSMPEGYNQVHQISGWSSNVVEFIDKFEQADDVIAEIESISPEDDF